MIMDKTKRVSFWLGTTMALGLLLVALRLTDTLALPWWVVLAPFWVPGALLLALPFGFYILGILLEQIEQ
jgi:hypothetical protein